MRGHAGPRRRRPGLVVTGLALAALAAAAAEPLPERRSGYEYMQPATRAMQDDDAANPGMLWVLEGERLWQAPPGPGAPACRGCHGEAPASMRGVAARYPAFDEGTGGLLDLEGRIERCRRERQGAAPLARESHDLLALTAYVGHQSRGVPIAVTLDERTEPFLAAGRERFRRRQGQLDLACADCHDDHPGRRLAGNAIPEAHPTGYPIYRLEWQGLGSLERRLRGCLAGMRAESYEPGSPALVELALYLAWRARGMVLETPAVRP